MTLTTFLKRKTPTPRGVEGSPHHSTRSSASPPSSPTRVSALPHTSLLRSKRQQPQVHSPIPKKPRFQQLFLELGQKNFGLITCPECKMQYSRGQEDDDAFHDKYHRAVIAGIEYPHYKNETVASRCNGNDESIVVVSKSSSPFEKRKLQEILEIVNTELGCPTVSDSRLDCSKIYLYVKNKKVVGCVVTESISHAFKVNPDIEHEHIEDCNDDNQLRSGGSVESSSIMISDQRVSAICGIHRLWISRRYRGSGVARKLLDCVRKTFLYGCNLNLDDLAFTQPTRSGKKFAEKYFKTKAFKVYMQSD
ncbi:hypothetical protein K493DRAFT_335140 [Basidiobolus meristosporus CBS 931.73]|uniref:Uncharacterized protein n=1 Tax=Basidiobolus meristosporus CBS 931.73 TaxID=1314790 RepID=A0A1Y1YSA7_9FUNG|nr:hypothetical protein K493DRAFT_335140 [Basidiobolus meristosporus CBS 931.73]|eukprot:ORY00913.1 hypothetical protein K493DRAFT_335140 [Basidiobolus meristosporus CBS 931.73]